MRRWVLTWVVMAGLASPAFIHAQEGSAGSNPTIVLGTVNLPNSVRVDGKSLPAGAYQIRLTQDSPPPVVGQSPEGARYVEFVRAGKVVAREVATVVSNTEITAIAESRRPAANSVRVETLKGNDYLRVWVNRAGSNYLIHLPKA